MDRISIDLLGEPKIMMDNKTVKIPLKKAEGLLYMLLLEGQMEKLRLCSYFWPEASPEISKKNLRNAIYILRKILNKNIFKELNRSTVELNRELFIMEGLDYLVEFDESYLLKSLNRDNINFMDNFHISNSYEFDMWIEEKRSKYISKLEKHMYLIVFDKKTNIDIKIKTCEKLIQHCNFNEKYYIELIKLYKEKKEWKKSISIYRKLEKILYTEFSLAPTKEVYDMVEEIIENKQRNGKGNRGNTAVKIRSYEMSLVLKKYEDFDRTSLSKSLMISGESGIGKTTLINSFKREIKDDYYILNMNCFKGEEGFSYESFRPVLGQVSNIIKNDNLNIPDSINLVLSTLYPGFSNNNNCQVPEKEINNNVIEQVFVSLFSLLSIKKKLIIIVDDINWIDAMSFRVIKKIISQLKYNIFTILACDSNSSGSQDQILEYLKSRNLLYEIKIARLSKNETYKFIKSNINMDFKTMDYIYEQSEGNPLFVMEYIKNLKQDKEWDIKNSSMGEFIKERINCLEEESKKFIEICAVFYDDINLNDLSKIARIDEITMIDTIEDLIDKNILNEQKDYNDEIELVFSHNQIKSFLRKEMTYSKRNLWNRRFAEYYERKIQDSDNDIELYAKLSYYFNECNDRVKKFKYRVQRFLNN